MVRVGITANKQGVTSEDCAVVTILKQVADAVLGVAGRVQSFHLDFVSDHESLAMARSLGDLVAVLSADDGKRITLENLGIPAGVVVVAVLGELAVLIECTLGRSLVGIDDVRQPDATVCSSLEVWQNSDGMLAVKKMRKLC